MDKGKVTSPQRIAHETKLREEMQKKIVEKYGHEAIRLATKRLCSRCKGFCKTLGFPICLNGEDCSYFEEKPES